MGFRFLGSPFTWVMFVGVNRLHFPHNPIKDVEICLWTSSPWTSSNVIKGMHYVTSNARGTMHYEE